MSNPHMDDGKVKIYARSPADCLGNSYRRMRKEWGFFLEYDVKWCEWAEILTISFMTFKSRVSF
jgi:hypothetical protein